VIKSIDLSIQNNKISLNLIEHFSHLARINESLNRGVLDHYRRLGLTYVDVPAIVGITGACENIDTLFKIGNRLGLPLFFTQTGQLALEQSLQSFKGCCTIIYSGRDEEEEDERHLRQFRLTEEEADCSFAGMTRENYDEDKMYEMLLSHIQLAVQSIIKQVLQDYGEVLRKVYHRDISRLKHAASNDFLRISYEDAITLLNNNKYKKVRFGDDLKAEHEALIVKLLNKKGTELPVFIMKYPKEIKFFNMKVSTTDKRVCLSSDLIFPYSGEGTGAAVREHDFEKLKKRLLTSTMYDLHLKRGGKYEDFQWYLDIVKSKISAPHAGYGLGNERVLQYIFAESDIRNVSLFSLLSRQTGDWDKKRYGQAAILTSSQKHILLAIGRLEDKKFLLPHVKKLFKQKNFVLYATKHSHEFFNKNGVLTSLVHKISEVGKAPNIGDLISRHVFDLIINIPTGGRVKEGLPTEARGRRREFTDGKLIRKAAVDLGISLITDPEVAAMTLDNLSRFHTPGVE